jgi:hypothetical protein
MDENNRIGDDDTTSLEALEVEIYEPKSISLLQKAMMIFGVLTILGPVILLVLFLLLMIAQQ